MKSLVYGCAAAAVLVGLGSQAYAEVVVRDAPVHTVPVEDDEGQAAEAAAPETAAEAAPRAAQLAKAEPAPVKALVRPKAPPAPALTPDEAAFFAVLGQRVTNAASAYESYVRRAGGIDPAAFSGAASVERALKTSAAYQPQQLQEGIVAYAALVALRNEAFVAGVRAVDNPAFADALPTAPGQVMQVRGAAEAAADVAGVLRAQGAAVTAAGQAITKAAYDIQTQPWSKSPVADPRGVLDAAKVSAGQTRSATTPSKARLLASLVTAPQTQGASPAAAPDVVRGLALAALAIMGKTGDDKEAQYEALLRDVSSANCLQIAKLNLNQCLAVAGPHYEDVYCAGRHAVSDTGKCVSAAAGGAPLPDAAPAPTPSPRIEEAEAYGPEQAEAYGKSPTTAPDELDDEDDDAPAPSRYAAAPPAQPPASSYTQNDYRTAQPPAAAYAASPYPQSAYTQPQYPQAQYPQTQYSQQQPYAAAGYPPAYGQQVYPQPSYGYSSPYGQPYAPAPYYRQGGYAYYGR